MTTGVAESAGRTDSRPGATELLAFPPGWIFNSLVAVFALLGLWSLSSPGADIFGLFGFAALGLAILCLGWVVRAGLWLVLSRRWSWGWVVTPLVMVLTVALASGDVPLKLRFHFAEAAFDRAVSTHQVPEHIGTYDIHLVTNDGAATLFITNSGFLSDAGFAYLPPGSHMSQINTPDGVAGLRHLTGNWYLASGTAGD